MAPPPELNHEFEVAMEWAFLSFALFAFLIMFKVKGVRVYKLSWGFISFPGG